MRRWIGGLPGWMLLAGGVLAPMALLLRVSLFAQGRGVYYEPGTWSTGAWQAVLGEPATRGVFVGTLGFAGITCGLTLALALPLSWWIARQTPRAAAVLLGAVLLPKLANMLVIVYGLMLVLSNSGSVNAAMVALGVIEEPVRLTGNLFGAVVAETYLLLAYPVLIVTTALRGIDPRLREAARSLGASELDYVRRVELPLVAPSLIAATTLTLIWSLGAFIGPMLLGGPQSYTVAVDVQRQAFEHMAWPRAAAEALALFGLMSGLIGAGRWILRGRT
jgi:ABC-type spermidine/putrescine transport system permease subunit I